MAQPAVAMVGDVPRAGVLLKPLRLRILNEARAPASATAIAAALGLTRQQVNYHVRALARAGFLRRAGRQRKRGLVEQKYVVSAQAFLLAPDVLGPMGPDAAAAPDKLGATYLLMLATQMQREAGRAWQQAASQGTPMPMLGLDSELHFENAGQRARFAEALTAAITRVVAENTAPASARTASARRYRLVLGCYPIAAETAAARS